MRPTAPVDELGTAVLDVDPEERKHSILRLESDKVPTLRSDEPATTGAHVTTGDLVLQENGVRHRVSLAADGTVEITRPDSSEVQDLVRWFCEQTTAISIATGRSLSQKQVKELWRWTRRSNEHTRRIHDRSWKQFWPPHTFDRDRDHVWIWCLAHREPTVRRQVGLRLSDHSHSEPAAMELVELVLADPDPRVRASLVQHPNPDVQRRLVEVLGARELRELARKATDMSTLMALAGIPDQGIVTDLASRLSGLQYEEALLDAILDNPACDDWARKYLARYWYLPERIFERIATEGGQRTLYGLALNDHASAGALEITYERADPESSDGSKTLEALAGNDSTPFRVLNQLAVSGFATAEVTLARHPDLSTDDLLRLARSPDSRIRRSAAGHPHLPDDHRKRLASDVEASVRSGVARRTDLDAETLDALVGDENHSVAWVLASNPSLKVTHLRRLADRAWPKLAQALLDRPDLPNDLERRLRREHFAE